jgi:hypothetical protein
MNCLWLGPRPSALDRSTRYLPEGRRRSLHQCHLLLKHKVSGANRKKPTIFCGHKMHCICLCTHSIKQLDWIGASSYTTRAAAEGEAVCGR